MCGRFTLITSPDELEDRFDATFEEPFSPRYNAAPAQKLPVILNTESSKIKLIHWGLMPAWVQEALHRRELINVRAETLVNKRTFRSDLQDRRCLILADGFYEWERHADGTKTPYRITLKNGMPFAFAGIWEINKDTQGNPLPTFAIVTTEPNDLLFKIHNRMPVILEESVEGAWLERPDTNLLQPFPADKMRAYPVSKLVNRTSIDRPEVILPTPTRAR